MIDYRTYSIEELATDEMFRRWVLSPTPEIDHFWKLWMRENPDRVTTVTLARDLIISVHELYTDDLSEQDIRDETAEIARLAAKSKRSAPFISPLVWRMAAAFLLVSGVTFLYHTFRSQSPRQAVVQEIQVIDYKLITHTNTTSGDMTVLLSDNSVATLSKGSSIRFPRNFDEKERKVYLTGEAFFDVAKNPDRPFLVFTNETVTKVLGTSFRVKAFDEDNTVLVAVKTGRVSVYPKNDYEEDRPSSREDKGIVLNPNQQALFLRKEKRLERGLVMHPEILAESTVQKDQIFEDKPVAEVLNSIEKMYGIQIQYDATVLTNCLITAQFNDENLRQRMNAVCQAIGATYDMTGGQIVLSSKGCN